MKDNSGHAGPTGSRESVRGTAQRATIAQIAARTGVSAGAVSYALNGRPGVSDATRARIREVADELGWVPSTAARALRGGRAAAVGLVITREPAVLGIEPFFMALVAGIESVISDQGIALLLQVTPDPRREEATYRQWWSARRVDGVFLTDLTVNDPRLAIVREIGLPAVVIGDPLHVDGMPAVGSDDAGAAESAVEQLVKLGHTRIGHVAGPDRYVHTRVRSAAMRVAATRLDASITFEVNTDYSLMAGSDACIQALATAEPPTALICDNDLIALGAVRAATASGVSVPRDLSILAWDDSPLCVLTEPPVSALSRDVSAYGADAARTLLAFLDSGGAAASVTSSVPVLVDRGTLARAPRPGRYR